MPRAGGLLDQDSLFVHYMFKVKEFDGIREQLDEADRKMKGGH